MPYSELDVRESKQPLLRKRETVVVVGARLRMGNHRFPKRVMSGELGNAGQRGPGGKKKSWTDCVVEDSRVLGITGDWSTFALDRVQFWYNTTVCMYVSSSHIARVRINRLRLPILLVIS